MQLSLTGHNYAYFFNDIYSLTGGTDIPRILFLICSIHNVEFFAKSFQVVAYGGYLEFSVMFQTLPGYERFTLIEETVPLVILQVSMILDYHDL